MHFNLLHILIIIYPVIIFLNLLHIHQFVDKQKTLLSKDNKVFLASQERFELPTVRLEGVCSIRLSYWDMERVKRIELSTRAWKALVLPLNYTRKYELHIRYQNNLCKVVQHVKKLEARILSKKVEKVMRDLITFSILYQWPSSYYRNQGLQDFRLHILKEHLELLIFEHDLNLYVLFL